MSQEHLPADFYKTQPFDERRGALANQHARSIVLLVRKKHRCFSVLCCGWRTTPQRPNHKARFPPQEYNLEYKKQSAAHTGGGVFCWVDHLADFRRLLARFLPPVVRTLETQGQHCDQKAP